MQILALKIVKLFPKLFDRSSDIDAKLETCAQCSSLSSLFLLQESSCRSTISPVKMNAYRAMSLFQPSNFALAIEQTQDPSSSAPKHLLGCIMSFPHTMVARSIAVLGFDYVMIDALHSYVVLPAYHSSRSE